MITKRINGAKFVLIRYSNRGAHALRSTWYPVVNLRWLRVRCDVTLA